MCYAEMEDVTTDGMVEDSRVKRDNIFGMVRFGGSAAEGMAEGQDYGTLDGCPFGNRGRGN